MDVGHAALAESAGRLFQEWTFGSLALDMSRSPGADIPYNGSDASAVNGSSSDRLISEHHRAKRPYHTQHQAFACHPHPYSGERGTYLPISSQSREFDLNPCFESLAIAPIPILLFIVFAAAQAGLLWRDVNKGRAGWKKTVGRSLTRLRIKIALFGLAHLASLAGFILLAIFTPHHLGNIDLLSPFLSTILYPIMLLVSHLKHHTSLRSSSAILAFWPIYLGTLAIVLRTRITMLIRGQLEYGPGEWVGMGAGWVGLGFGVAGWVVECFGPENGGIRLEEVEEDDDLEDVNGLVKKHKTYQAVFHDDTEEAGAHANGNGNGHGNGTSDELEQGGESGPMEEKLLSQDDRESPVLRSNLYGVLTFSWLTPMMKLGVKRFITEDDMWPLPKSDSSEQLIHRLSTAWEYEREKVRLGKKKSPSLKISLCKAYGRPYLVAGILKAFYDCLSFTQPQMLRLLLVFVQSYSTTDATGPSVPQPPIQGFAIACAMFLSANCATLLLHQYFDRCFATTMRIRGGLVQMVYKKSLNLSNGERSGRTTGDIINLQSVDATRIADLTQYLHIAWSGLFQIFLAFVSLYTLIGWQAFCGVAVMVVSLPVNAAIARKMKKLQKEQMVNKDTRTRLMNEILSNIKSIKLYGWEPAFKEKVYEVRNNRELRMLKKIAIYQGCSFFFWASTPFMVAFATFATFAVTSSTPLTSEKIFPAISLFGLLSFPLAVFSNIISSLIEALVSVARLETYFAAKELQADARQVILPEKSNGYLTPRRGEDVVTITSGEFKWNEDAVVPTLTGIDLSVKKGQLLALIGRVGTGKTSLLSAILGEMTRTEGSVIVRGEIAYFAQSSYVLSASLKENIVFGHTFDQTFYDVVLDACALRPDLAVLPQGDQTEVGEKGVSLSGGQKARIALARAVYARADLYLLDDPLAAVDAHVGKHIFDNVLGPNGLLKTKARVLCTNSLTWLKECDEILMLRDGIIIDRGTFPSAMANTDGELYSLITGLGQQEADSEEESKEEEATALVDKDSETDDADVELEADALRVAKMERRFSSATIRKASMLSIRQSKLAAVRELKTDAKPQEHREQGQVKRTVYASYIKAASRIGFALFLLLTALAQASSISGNVVLRYWGRVNSAAHETTDTAFYLGIYGLVGVGSSMINVASTLILTAYCAIACSKHLHDRSFDALMRAPLSYFELTPQGRILNIFSRDMLVVDEVLVRVFQGFFRTLASVVGVMAVIAIGAPIVLVAVIPLGLIYRRIMRYYLSSSRELKRLDAVTRSPIFSWFSESIMGSQTIRAYGQVGRFISNNEARVDRNQTCYMPAMSVNRWLAIRLEALGSCLMFAAALTSVSSTLLSKQSDAGLVGIVMSYVISVTGSLNWLVRSASEVENNIVSVERILGYTELNSEAAEYIPETKPAPSWPQKGSIEFKNLSVRYRPELDFALRDVSFKIEGGERVGVVGRTGSGKSTTTLALFRIIEAAAGSIEIDGIDISTIGLHDLRSELSLIPQDPSLFEGTLRNNIDPLNTASDQEIWKALEQSWLKDMVVNKLGGTLDAKIAEGGSSLSSGEKQLVCFARALLRKTKILVLDEATSSIDLETDEAVQKILRGPDFAHVTTFTIAHRINTILDSDRVLVLDQGRVAEFDSPEALLLDKGSIFAGLCAQAGIKGTGEATPSGSRTPATPGSRRGSKAV